MRRAATPQRRAFDQEDGNGLFVRALTSFAGCNEITPRDTTHECCVCKVDWESLKDEDPQWMKWHTTRACIGHYVCSTCLYKLTYTDHGELVNEYKCPICRQTEQPQEDKSQVPYNKCHLSKLSNADKEETGQLKQ